MVDPTLKGRAALCAAALFVVVLPLAADESSAEYSAKNVIVMIVDGGGYNHFDAARLYETGESYQQATVALQTGAIEQVPGSPSQVYDYYPVQLAMSHYSASGRSGYEPDQAWASFDWVLEGPTDSAAAATALSTGAKTDNRTLGMDSDGTTLVTAGEQAMRAGKKVGLVSSVPFNHATPAAFIAHGSDRGDYHDIATEMIDSGVDVIIGGGHPGFNDQGEPREKDFGEDSYISEDDFDRLIDGDTPFTFTDDVERLKEIAAGQDVPDKLFGLAPVASTFQFTRPGMANDDVAPYTDPFLDGVPTLSAATRAALQVLAQDDDGFFLMVEGGAVDWAAHENQTTRMIEELLGFNGAVEAVDAWVRQNSSWDETIVIVTADHETGYLTGPGSGDEIGWTAITGEVDQLPNVQWHGQKHSNSLVPLYAQGAGAQCLVARATGRDPVRGHYVDNTAVGGLVQTLLSGKKCAGLAA